jgi:hypothetical protein
MSTLRRSPASRELRVLRSRVAGLTTRRPPDDPDLIAARRELIALALRLRIAEALAAEPKITINQRRELASHIMRGVTS